jgi:hypothetical protein
MLPGHYIINILGLSLGSQIWEQGRRALFTTLHFLSNLRNRPNKLDCFNTLGWKGFPGANTLGYWVHLYVKKKIKCCEYAPWSLYY